jgi:hypothetical protein
MNNKLKIKENTALNNITDEQIVAEIKKLKNKTKEVGIRMMKHCDDIEDIAEITQNTLDGQTECMETIITDLTELDAKVKESKSLTKQFSSWFGIFRSTKRKTEYVFKEEEKKEEKKKQNIPEKKQNEEYDFDSDDPANEIAKALESRIDKFEQYANGYNKTLKKHGDLIEVIDDKISKSECDIQKVSHKIKKY